MRPPQQHGPWERALRALPFACAGIGLGAVAALLATGNAPAALLALAPTAWCALLSGLIAYRQSRTDSHVARLGRSPGWTFHRYRVGQRLVPVSGPPFTGSVAWMTSAADRTGAGNHLTVFRFTTGSGGAALASPYVGIATLLPVPLPEIELRPREEALPDSLTGHDLAFESEDFNLAYHVSAADRRAAYLLLHPRAIEALLAVPPFHLAARGRVLVGWTARADAFELAALAEAVGTVAAQAPTAV